MTDKEVLIKALEKTAQSSGFCAAYLGRINSDAECSITMVAKVILFDHSFAKAFWGSECTDTGLLYDGGAPGEAYTEFKDAWEHHLQQMVLEENPIDYIRKFK